MHLSALSSCSLLVIAAASAALPGCLDTGSEVDGTEMGSETRTEQSLTGYRIVTGETRVTPLATKQLSVACPQGTKALGAGWGVLDTTGAILDGVASYFEPSFDGSSWLVNARSTSAFAASWKLRVQVVCGSAALAGYEVVSSETAVTATGVKQLAPACPNGKRSLGAGWAALDATSAILDGEALYVAPGFDGRSWIINARSNAASSGWKLHSRLVCVNDSAVAGYEIVTVESPASATDPKQLGVGCPAGKTSTGLGWSVLDPTGAILEGRATFAGLSGASWLTNARSSSGFAATWKLRVQAICTL